MWIHYVERFMTNNECLKEDWYEKWWSIIANANPILQGDTNQHSNSGQNENFIHKQLREIREKCKEDRKRKERERKSNQIVLLATKLSPSRL